LGTIGKARQRVVMREETDASIRLLLFLGSTIPGDAGDADRATRAGCGRIESEGIPKASEA
jgi:hypothetical protein